ncbi:serine/threonine-protein kinase [Parafrankia elaeagni]|uniref:serine/threonine-protein kinase n=1 Tax=Parafrankia elaeagni TaxID=222534 RepID=UPI00039D937B|nr:serine/threonine-protein kinase [Parafrankia elaeagni]
MIVDRSRVAAAVPNYVLGEQLGSGAFGLVLRAEHRRMRRPAAIKVMPAEGARIDFAAEARLLAGLDHPHVVRVYDYIEADDLCLVVMELLAGGTLTRRRATLSAGQTCAVGLAVAAALGHAHDRGVLHRDVKADNILFAADGTVKVGDFGIAKLFEGSAATVSKVVGTPIYMAPEQIDVGGRLGPATDLYALSAVLYTLLAGRPPFDPKQPLHLLWHQLRNEPAPPMDGVPGSVAQVVLRGLEKDPAARHPDPAGFALDLAGAAAEAYGVDWIARTGMPLHLDDAVRRAAVRPVTVRRAAVRSPADAVTELVQDIVAEGPTARPDGLPAFTGPAPGSAGSTSGTAVTASADTTEGRYAGTVGAEEFARLRHAHGADHHTTLAAANELALRLSALGRHEEARELDEDVLGRLHRQLGPDHPDTLTSAHNLAVDLTALGAASRARDLCQDTLRRRRSVLGPDHPDTLDTAHNLGMLCSAGGEHGAARELGEDTLARRRRVLGPDHPETLTAAFNLAARLGALGEFEAARELGEDTLARRRRMLGPDHPETLVSAFNVAFYLGRLGRYLDAGDLCADIQESRGRSLGPGHPDTLAAEDAVAWWFHQAGRDL